MVSRVLDTEGEPLAGITVSAERAQEEEGPRRMVMAFTAINGEGQSVVSTGEDLGDTSTLEDD